MKENYNSEIKQTLFQIFFFVGKLDFVFFLQGCI